MNLIARLGRYKPPGDLWVKVVENLNHLLKKSFFICLNDSPSKMMKNAFYFILKALFVLKIFKPLT